MLSVQGLLVTEWSDLWRPCNTQKSRTIIAVTERGGGGAISSQCDGRDMTSLRYAWSNICGVRICQFAEWSAIVNNRLSWVMRNEVIPHRWFWMVGSYRSDATAHPGSDVNYYQRRHSANIKLDSACTNARIIRLYLENIAALASKNGNF